MLIDKGMPVTKIFLFGSYSRNEENNESDIDLAVVLKSYNIDRFTTRLELMKYSRNFDMIIEPHPFLDSDFNETNAFSGNIIKEGIEIYT
jgi:predicted nucleotidyltransferase